VNGRDDCVWRPTDTRVALLPVVGADLAVPLVDGTSVRYANLDYAASAPALVAVRDAVDELLPWYSSVGRGAGFPSSVTTDLLDMSRQAISAFVGARPDDSVIFTRNTTDALNLLASVLPTEASVLTFDSEHHANLLPWRRRRVEHLPLPTTPHAAVASLERALREAGGAVSLVAVTAASNVTGELFPLAQIVAAAHHGGARVVVDAAQLTPHRAVDLSHIGADYLAFSGHKLYAPFGCGVLVGRSDWLDAGEPYLAGGGAVRRVWTDRASWATSPSRHEAGTPNVVGAVAIAAACEALLACGRDRIARHDEALVSQLVDGLRSIPGARVLSLWETPLGSDPVDRVGIISFVVRGQDAGLLASMLSAEHGIGLRDGAFCAHPTLDRLLGAVDDAGPPPRALRASVGVGSTSADIDRLLVGLRQALAGTSSVTYEMFAGRPRPVDDVRPRPVINALARWMR